MCSERKLKDLLSHDKFMDYFWVTDWFISKRAMDFVR